MEVKFPEVVVPLTSGDGNAYAIIGTVRRALRGRGYKPTPFASSPPKQAAGAMTTCSPQ